MDIQIKFIPHAEQRYDTLGDWFREDGVLQIRVSNDQRLSEHKQFLVALHELIEVKLCEIRGITIEEVDTFDFCWASDDPNEEPGDHPDAPYRKEHRFAMMIEHLMAHEMGLTGYGVVR